jgi:succinylglutamate desuccinylase
MKQGGRIFDYRIGEDLEIHDYDWFVDRIKEFDQYANVEIKIIGKSRKGYDMYGIDIIPENEPVGQIVVVGGHHGKEPAGPEAAIKFIEKVLHSETAYAKELKKNYRISVVPIVNVDQYVLPANRQFHDDFNSHYQNLDYGYPEERATADFFLSRMDVNHVITFDLHETLGPWFTGFGIIENLQEPKKNYARSSITKLRNEGYPIFEDIDFIDGVSQSHYYKTFTGLSYKKGANAYSFESPMFVHPLKSRVEMHLIAMDAILSKILDEKIKKT